MTWRASRAAPRRSTPGQRGSASARAAARRRGLVCAALAGALVAAGPAHRAHAAAVTLEVFTRPGCPRCADARDFLARELAARADVTLVERDVTRDRAALDRLRALAARAGVATPGVPAFAVGESLVVGFEPDTGPARIRALLAGSIEAGAGGAICAPDAGPCPEAAPTRLHLPWIGEVSVERLGLPLFTLAIGLIDGFNPCATWVLLFLLAMLVNLRSRARMALIAGTFVVVSGAVYFAFMAAWLTFFDVVGVSDAVRLALAALALLIGGLNVKDFFAFGRGPSLGISARAKPGFYARVRAIVRAENLAGALAGIVAIAFLVNLIELLCTAGLPALYTAILTSRELSAWEYYSYLVLYIVAYMLDDALLVTIGVITLGKHKLQERGGRWLKLISGVTIVALGVALLVRPGWLGT